MLNNWSSSAASGASASSSAASESNVSPQSRSSNMETIEEMKSKQFQVRKLGFVEDAIVAPKDVDIVTFLRISKMEDETVKLVLTSEGHDVETQEIGLDTLVAKYRLHKGRITEMLPGWSAEDNACSPMASTLWTFEAAKSAITIAMRSTYAKHECHVKDLELLQHPNTVKVTRAFSKHELHLPAASMKIERKAGKGTFDVGLGLHIASHFSPPIEKSGERNKSAWVVPFWMVGASSEDEPPNMVLRHERIDVLGSIAEVPVLVNSVPLKIGAVLRWDKDSAQPSAPEPAPKAKPVAAKKAASAAKPKSKQPPTKRART